MKPFLSLFHERIIWYGISMLKFHCVAAGFVLCLDDNVCII